MQAYSYKRWSSDKQTKGDSLNRQSDSARAVCTQKQWDLDDTLQPDAGLSAFHGRNLKEGSIAVFRDAVKSGRIKTPCALVLDDMSRLTRLPIWEALQEFHEIVGLGVIICTANDGKEYEQGSMNKLAEMVSLIVSFEQNNRHSAELSRKVGAAWKRKKERASEEILTTTAPAWLDVVKDKNGKRVFEENEKAGVIRRIFKEYSRGAGIRTIVRGLNHDKIPTHGRGNQSHGNGWAATHVRRILGYRQVLGEYQPCKHVVCEGKKCRIPDGEAVPNYYRAIVDKPTFYKVQQMLPKSNGKGFTGGHARGRTGNVTNLFKGFVKCRYCGGSMVIKLSGQQRGYSYTSLVCSNMSRGNGCGPYATIQYSHVERAVLTLLFSKILPEMKQQDSKAEQLLTLQGEFKVINAHIKQMTEDYEKDPSRLIAQSLAKKEARQAELTKEIEATTATMADDGILAWEPIEKTAENRLRLAVMLRQEVESLLIDAKGLKAILTLKDPDCGFMLSWERPNGNHVQKNSASQRFTMEGAHFEPKLTPYLDEVLVWQSEHNVGKVIEMRAAA